MLWGTGLGRGNREKPLSSGVGVVLTKGENPQLWREVKKPLVFGQDTSELSLVNMRPDL